MAETNSTNDGWHLDKKVPISIIVVLLTQAAAGLWAIADIKRDVEVLKAAQIEQHERDKRQDDSSAEALRQIREAMADMNRKLDRLIERGMKPS
jgi:Tfp pilus assembly protein PilO